ncbi:MAG: dTMP kinase [Phycisphaeraceae bacterium]|nr:dTMP kinase [Phycisphaeraceae bacterium]
MSRQGGAVANDSWIKGLAGRFIVFDGPDGSGKSTQFKRLLETASRHGVPVCPVRDPGGTPVGERIRDILLDRAHTGMGVRCETLLYMASRAELVDQMILPAMQRGELVLADRFVPSTLAYQGAAGGVPKSEIAAVAKMATRGLMPDLIVIFDIDESAAAARLSPLLDRMEAKGREFHRAVRKGYLDQVEADPARYVLVDASRAEDAVWRELSALLAERASSLPSRSRPPGSR